jgi:hypothetical protein
VRQHLGIHLVGLDLGRCDGLGSQRITDHDAAAMRGQRIHHRPGVGGVLQRDRRIRAKMLSRKAIQRAGVQCKATDSELRSRLIRDMGLHDALVDVESDEPHGSPPECALRGSRWEHIGNYLFVLEAHPDGPRGGQI